MKYLKLTVVLLAICMIALPSFTKKAHAKKGTDMTLYYWFDADNNFIETNLVDDECLWTGFDQFQYPPMTLEEKGFVPARVYDIGNGQYMPVNAYCPDKRLYTHP